MPPEELKRWLRRCQMNQPRLAVAAAAAHWLLRLDADWRVALAGFALAAAEAEGSSRITLSALAGLPVCDEALAPCYPDLDDWLAALHGSDLVGVAESRSAMVLIDDKRLSLRRLFEHEAAVARAVVKRVLAPQRGASAELASGLTRVFGDTNDTAEAAQRRACELALTRSLLLLTGGPGTGKTSAVARLIAVALSAAGPSRRLRIALAAPTGKAARRLSESLQSNAALAGSVLPEAQTLHRLLGAEPGRVAFRHSAEFPLEADLVIVDEASMIDLSLMRHLLDALPETAQLVLVGDADQLAPVEVGTVFADLVTALESRADDSVLRLSHNYRATAELASAAQAIRQHDAEALLALLDHGSGGLSFYRCTSAAASRVRFEQLLLSPSAAAFDAWLSPAVDANLAFAALARVRVLAAPRQGALGVVELNRLLERGLATRAQQQQLPRPRLPQMLTRNLPEFGLANGDIGLPERAMAQSAVRFQIASKVSANQHHEASTRLIPRSAFANLEAAGVMTVHKAQGSEFDTVWLILPDADSPLLSRQWLYTAVTRARLQFTLIGSEAALRRAIASTLWRDSGLPDRLREIGLVNAPGSPPAKDIDKPTISNQHHQR